MSDTLTTRGRQTLARYEREYEQLKVELQSVGYILPGSLTKRMMQCGAPSCRCHEDQRARHGPYLQWSWDDGGRTASVYLNQEQASRCGEWIANNRRMRRILRRMRTLSVRVASLHKIGKK